VPGAGLEVLASVEGEAESELEREAERNEILVGPRAMAGLRVKARPRCGERALGRVRCKSDGVCVCVWCGGGWGCSGEWGNDRPRSIVSTARDDVIKYLQDAKLF
jgi:hypothetical protein